MGGCSLLTNPLQFLLKQLVLHCFAYCELQLVIIVATSESACCGFGSNCDWEDVNVRRRQGTTKSGEQRLNECVFGYEDITRPVGGDESRSILQRRVLPYSLFVLGKPPQVSR